MLKIDDKVIEETVRGFSIPSKPKILMEIQEITQGDDPSIADVSSLVAADVGLSAAILMTINSPFFGMSRTISDINQAVFMLGLSGINSIVSSYVVRTVFTGNACISLERFWDTATDVANVMLHIGNSLKNTIPMEDLYAIGLFHDSGIPAMAMKFSDYRDTLIRGNDPDIPETLIELEEARYNTNHAVIGYYIATSWNLPRSICNIILQHHSTDFLKHMRGTQDELSWAVLKMAESIIDRHRRFSDTPDWKRVHEQALDVLGLTSLDYADLEDDISEILG